MKSYWIKSQGQGTVLEVRDIPEPVPGPGQLLLRVHAASLNRGDLLAAIARHRADVARPAGVDGAGEIKALGPGVSGFMVGERVMVRAKGIYAPYCLVDVAQAVPVPGRLSWEQAAAVPVAFITAWESLFQFGHLQAGEWVLIAGISSGVGVAALQQAKCIGAKVIGVSGSAEKLARLKTLGMDVGILARDRDYSAEAIAASGGKGVNLAVNLVGGTAYGPCQRALADFGRMAIVGYVDHTMKAEFDLEAVHGKRLQIFGVSNSPLNAAQRAEAMRGCMADFLPALADGRIVPVVDRAFPFDQLEQAKAYVETDVLLGKVVVTLP